MALEVLWRAADSAAFDSRQWGDDLVLYVLSSGETHALSAAHSATLLTLLDEAGTAKPAPEWLAAMSSEVDADAGMAAQLAADLQALNRVLADLQDIGVVECLSV